MLITFKVSNFLSFSEEQSLSMIPSIFDNNDLIQSDCLWKGTSYRGFFQQASE